MIFQNPLAWLGLLAVAIPVLAHLLARRPARHEPFPTIRFLPAATLKPVRRGRPSDWPLLVIRIGIITAAVAALTQPIWVSASRERAMGEQIARAIIVDTSRSLERPAAGGERGVDVARREARRIAAESTRARIEETAAPASLVAGSVNWLSTQPMRREVVVISDFQLAAVAPADLEQVPADVGRKLIPISLTGEVAPAAASDPTVATVRLLTSEAEQRDADAARAAALATGAPAATRRDWPAAVMFPSFAARESWLRSATPLTQAWMFDVAARVHADPVVKAALDRGDRDAAQAIQFLAGPLESTESLVVVLTEKPHSLLAAATINALLRAAADTPTDAELQTNVRATSELRALEREPSAAGTAGRSLQDDQSDGRWFWAAALLLLIVEIVMRRTRRQADVEVPHARVA